MWVRYWGLSAGQTQGRGGPDPAHGPYVGTSVLVASNADISFLMVIGLQQLYRRRDSGQFIGVFYLFPVESPKPVLDNLTGSQNRSTLEPVNRFYGSVNRALYVSYCIA